MSKNNSYVLQYMALRQLIAEFNAKSPETRRSFFKNVKKIRTLFREFVREMNLNCTNIPRYRKLEYLRTLETEFGTLKFIYNAPFLDMEFKRYGEDFQSFPEVGNVELADFLRVKYKEILHDDLSPEKRKYICDSIRLQHECLLFFYHLKVQKILELLAQMYTKKKQNLENLESGNLKNALILNRQAEKAFFTLLEEQFHLPADGHNSPAQVQEEKAKLLEKIRNSTHKIDLELDDNVILLPQLESKTYLRRVLTDLENYRSQWEPTEAGWSQMPEKSGGGTLFSQELVLRKDVLEALQELRACRQNVVIALCNKIQGRLDLYTEISAGGKMQQKLPPHDLFVGSLQWLGFFSLPSIKSEPNTAIAGFLSFFTGRGEQNLRESLGERYLPSRELKEKSLKVVKQYFPNFDPEVLEAKRRKG